MNKLLLVSQFSAIVLSHKVLLNPCTSVLRLFYVTWHAQLSLDLKSTYHNSNYVDEGLVNQNENLSSKTNDHLKIAMHSRSFVSKDIALNDSKMGWCFYIYLNKHI